MNDAAKKYTLTDVCGFEGLRAWMELYFLSCKLGDSTLVKNTNLFGVDEQGSTSRTNLYFVSRLRAILRSIFGFFTISSFQPQRHQSPGSCARAYPSGFGFLELIIVLAIMGILSTMVAPALLSLRSGNERREFVSSLQLLTRRAWQEALTNHQLYRIRFDLEHHKVIAERATGQKERSGEEVWLALSDTYVPSTFEWSSGQEIKDFFIDGVDNIHVRGTNIHEVYFFIFPDGTAQRIIINIFDSSEHTESAAGSRFSLVLNPLTVRFTEFPTFQKP